MRKLQIGVVGSAGPEEYPKSKPNANMYKVAEELGKKLSQEGAVVVNGGKGGVMLAVAKGAKSGGGITVAEVSGLGRCSSNSYVDVEIVTGDVAFRGPSQLVAMSDAIVAIGGGAGTLQEICVAYRMGKPIVLLVGYGGWVDRCSRLEYLDERQLTPFYIVTNSKMAAQRTLELARAKLNELSSEKEDNDGTIA